jgi:hypothetical protein
MVTLANILASEGRKWMRREGIKEGRGEETYYML